MDSSMLKIQRKLDVMMKYLNPLLPLANCHMVEFFTDSHWDRLVPEQIAQELEIHGMDKVVNNFWEAASDNNMNDASTSPVSQFMQNARLNSLMVDNEICLSVNDFETKIKNWGGILKPEIHVKEFMNSKKSYEVQTMSRLVAGIHCGVGATHCVDAGGGRGQLPAVLALAYGMCALTIDCDPVAIESGRRRERLIQKQWHAIAKTAGKAASSLEKYDCGKLHKFINSFVTKNTNLNELVRNAFPEEDKDIKLLLTGLHTCGNLGPDSLRLLTSGAAAAMLTVPCCYHLLTEAVDDQLWDVFERNFAEEKSLDQGFPMSDFMKGRQLGRNARMLASQSIERAAHERRPPPRSLLYRAVLQMIIKKHLPTQDIAEGKLKRISSKCETLRAYVTAADDILNLGLSRLSDETLELVFSEYDSQWDKIVVFYLLRLCLAQVIEGVILLDRLLYLKECGVKEACLVRLFDPVLSPRCHAIVAIS